MKQQITGTQLSPKLNLSLLSELQPTFTSEKWLELLRATKPVANMNRTESYEKNFLNLPDWQKLQNLSNSTQKQVLAEIRIAYPQLYKILVNYPSFNPQEIKQVDRIFINDTNFPDEEFTNLKQQFNSCKIINITYLVENIASVITEFIIKNPNGKIVIPGNGGKIVLKELRKKMSIEENNLIFIQPTRILDELNRSQITLAQEDANLLKTIQEACLIVDDVISSGATLQSFCKELTSAEGIQICAFVARARGVFPKKATNITVGLYVESASGKIPVINTLENLQQSGEKAKQAWALINKNFSLTQIIKQL